MSDETPQQDPSADDDDVKRRFREALVRKQGKKESHGAGPHAGSKVHGTGSAQVAKRMFRRKSG